MASRCRRRVFGAVVVDKVGIGFSKFCSNAVNEAFGEETILES